jgi:hypothetical protein
VGGLGVSGGGARCPVAELTGEQGWRDDHQERDRGGRSVLCAHVSWPPGCWSGAASPRGAVHPVATGRYCAPRSCCCPARGTPTPRSPGDLTAPRSRSGSGDDDIARRASRAWMRSRGRAVRGRFPPAQVAEIKALACELPAESAAVALVGG